MNIALRTPGLRGPSTRDLMDRALDPYLLIGMPHLTPYGLSETWLMKELGHRHWLMLARELGLENADFRTRNGEPAYAAICATSLRNARLQQVEANDVLTIHSALRPISRAQYSSTHSLHVGAQLVADVELISTFVIRRISGDNRSLARMETTAPVPPVTTSSPLADVTIAIRRGTISTYLGLGWEQPKDAPSIVLEPSGTEEFNGAGLFYFAQFQAMVSRAFDAWFPTLRGHSSPGLVRRDVFFSGNICPSETIRVTLCDSLAEPDRTCCCLSRADGQTIGRIFSSAG